MEKFEVSLINVLFKVNIYILYLNICNFFLIIIFKQFASVF